MSLRRRRLERASDAVLLAGDADAFGVFYRRHAGIVFGWLRRRTGQPDLAADIAAETFARALQGRGGFDASRGEARSWLFGIARHVLARSLERGRVEDDVRQKLQMQPVTLTDAALDAIDEGAGDAMATLAELPPEQVAAITGRLIEDQDYEDLADELDCSPSVVRKRVSRGLAAMRATLEARR